MPVAAKHEDAVVTVEPPGAHDMAMALFWEVEALNLTNNYQKICAIE
jgi:hypothetical protein